MMIHVTYVNGSFHIREFVEGDEDDETSLWMLTRCMSHATYMNESCHVYEFVETFKA